MFSIVIVDMAVKGVGINKWIETVFVLNRETEINNDCYCSH